MVHPPRLQAQLHGAAKGDGPRLPVASAAQRVVAREGAFGVPVRFGEHRRREWEARLHRLVGEQVPQGAPRARLGEGVGHQREQPVVEAVRVGPQKGQGGLQPGQRRGRVTRMREEERPPQHKFVAARGGRSVGPESGGGFLRPACDEGRGRRQRPPSPRGGVGIFRGGAGHLRLRLVRHAERQHGRGEFPPPRGPREGLGGRELNRLRPQSRQKPLR